MKPTLIGSYGWKETQFSSLERAHRRKENSADEITHKPFVVPVLLKVEWGNLHGAGVSVQSGCKLGRTPI